MNKSLLIPIIAFMFCSCKELYNDYQAELNEEYLVVEGMISDNPGPYYVTINKALAYSNNLDLRKYKTQPEKNAIVIVKTDAGNEYVLHELSDKPGTYATNAEDFTGQIGQKYSLYIQTPNGEIYESAPMLLAAKPDIKELFAESAERTVLDESVPGYQRFVTQQGLKLSCDIDNQNASKYIKVDLRIITTSTSTHDSIFYPSPSTPEPIFANSITYYCWSIRPRDPDPNIIATNGDTTILQKIPLGFVLRSETFTYSDTAKTYPNGLYIINDEFQMINGMITTIVHDTSRASYYLVDIKAYCIDDETYEYYRNLKNQLTAYTKIFDPIPAQLTGNMKCTSHPDKSIFGIFTAASLMQKQFSVSWYGPGNRSSIKKFDVYYPIENNGCSQGEPPGFWGSDYK
jgi:hypothetical protein